MTGGGFWTRGWWPAALLALPVAVVVLVVAAPANWLARYVADRSDGRILLADARGTLWNGSAVLAFGEGGAGTRLALPGRVNWTIEITGGLAPVLHLTQDGVLDGVVDLRRVGGAWTVNPGSAVLPAGLLTVLGAPFNTLQPVGRCRLGWGPVRIASDGVVSAAGTLDVQGFALALSPVRPLGDYRVEWTNDAAGLNWRLTTQHGPLQVDGAGTAATRGALPARLRITVQVAPDAPPGIAAQLKPLLATLGTSDTGQAVIESGARGLPAR